MKKILMVLLAATITLTSTVPAFAVTIAVEENLEYNTKYVATEKHDKNTLYFYKKQSEQYSKAYVTYLNKQAKSITADATNDYDKFKAISKWVSDNVWYDHDLGRSTSGNSVDSKCNYFNADHSKYSDVETIAGDKTQCDGYADLTVGLLRAVGIPAKEVLGYYNSRNHAWVEAYVDGKWHFSDPTFNSRNNYNNGKWYEQTPSDNHYFDMPLATWSLDHRVNAELIKEVGYGDSSAWDGKLLFYSADNGRIKGLAKAVSTNLSAGAKLDSTYGFNAKDLYKDYACTESWDLDNDVVDESHYVIYVKNYKPYQYTIYFDSLGGTDVNLVSVASEDKNAWVSIDAPAKPTRDGYDFVGWYPANYEYYAGAKVVDFKTDQVYNGEKFNAIWKDKSTGSITYAPTNTNTTTTTDTTDTTAPNTATTPTTTTPTIKITGWYKADGHWTYYSSKGLMKSSWLNDNGNWYYLDDSGVMKTGWLNYCRAWYYLNADGTRKTGWLKDNGKWYYLRANNNGAMAHDTVTPDGYTVGSDGAWIN